MEANFLRDEREQEQVQERQAREAAEREFRKRTFELQDQEAELAKERDRQQVLTELVRFTCSFVTGLTVR